MGGGGGEMELRVSYSAYLILPDSYLHLIILAITSALVLLGLLLAIYKRWQQVSATAFNPNQWFHFVVYLKQPVKE